MFYLNPTNYQDHWILAPTKHGVSSRRSWLGLTTLSGIGMTAVETTTRLAVGSLEKIFAHVFLGYVFFRWEFTLNNTTQCVCVGFFLRCVFYLFFFIILFQLMVRLLSCWFFGAFWVPFLASEDRSPNMKNVIFGIGKKTGKPDLRDPKPPGPTQTNKQLLTPPMFNSSPLKNGGFSRPVGFW